MNKFIYKCNDMLRDQLKDLLKEKRYKNSDIAEKMNISPQNFSNIINKKKFLTFDDVSDILNVINYDLVIEFKPQKNNKQKQETYNTTLTEDMQEIIKSIQNIKNSSYMSLLSHNKNISKKEANKKLNELLDMYISVMLIEALKDKTAELEQKIKDTQDEQNKKD
ncbi:helix-turn-helix transcriptional regulator [uncultured Thomasclavelia sp.]|uniref:helix-turn-helix domain-containing protein n=1 Tax=uncultured Thomasclavelia sp. TaxID=3025759 RepID=UPI002637D420|nr:helix-turn-helix transcriptional regulator [uncultured Thomasclavelia sp.]